MADELAAACQVTPGSSGRCPATFAWLDRLAIFKAELDRCRAAAGQGP